MKYKVSIKYDVGVATKIAFAETEEQAIKQAIEFEHVKRENIISVKPVENKTPPCERRNRFINQPK